MPLHSQAYFQGFCEIEYTLGTLHIVIIILFSFLLLAVVCTTEWCLKEVCVYCGSGVPRHDRCGRIRSNKMLWLRWKQISCNKVIPELKYIHKYRRKSKVNFKTQLIYRFLHRPTPLRILRVGVGG